MLWNGMFVAVARGNNTIAYSTNGINWTGIVLSFVNYWRSICYGNGTFVAVGSDTNIVAFGTMEKENLQTVIDNKADTWQTHDSSYAALSHTHTLS